MEKAPIKSEHVVGIIIAVGLALAVALTVQEVLMPETGAGPSEAERKKALEKALEKGNLSLEDARYWRVVEETQE